MPNKLQLKLVSNSGELLSMVTCQAGRISVLRASTPSDLRPYQRALSGSSTKENLEVLCDGAEYNPDQHIVIGFGEPSPTAGFNVKEFLAKEGVSELAIESVLLSIGLEGVAHKRCSELTSDQEARLRLLAATAHSEKLLVLNDPFEHIASQWRERAAEMLSQYARSRKALIVIPALSYRPECWISNDCVERIEVGQTQQRTIGFGSAGSQSTSAMNELRDKLRADPRFSSVQSDSRGKDSEKAAGAAVAGIAAGAHVSDLTDASKTAKLIVAPPVAPPAALTFLKAGSVLVGVAVGSWVALSFSDLSQELLKNSKPTTQVASLSHPPEHAAPKEDAPQPHPAHMPEEPSQQVNTSQPAARLDDPLVDPKKLYLLDAYPSTIKASILDTAKGVSAIVSLNTTGASPAQQAKPEGNAGNLFSLLASAGSNQPGDNVTESAPSYGDNYSNNSAATDYQEAISPDEEEQRREDIRNRFLEAIRASAARRQAAMGEAPEDDY